MPKLPTKRLISLDTETTGVDLRHGAKPFFVTTCLPDGTQRFWEWDVDPLTREPQVPAEDLVAIDNLIASADELVLQNAKFDAAALGQLGIDCWPWERTHDTLIAGHLLASNHPHDLTSMAIEYLGVDIQLFEDRLEKAVKECRTICKRDHPDWLLAGTGVPGMPSAKEKTWKYDTWLPAALANHRWNEGQKEFMPPVWNDEPHHWWTVLAEYANADSAVTVQLWQAMRQEVERRGLWEIYLERMKAIPVAAEMERRGVTISRARLEQLRADYRRDSEQAAKTCVAIAKSYKYVLDLPKSGNNGSLSEFCFGPDLLNLPAVKQTETGKPALDKESVEGWIATLPPGSKQLEFVTNLRAKRKRDTALNYLEGYEKFWLPLPESGTRGSLNLSEHRDDPQWFILHPNLNPTGTDTLRWSSNNPNEQNISKLEGFNLRFCFGPAPGREWWSLDYQNLELRIPAFEAGERDLMHVFEHPDEPPYFGSYHLVVFDLLHPEKFKEHGKACKTLFESSWYQWTKNGNFAVLYGCQEAKADQTYHVRGAYRKIRSRFAKMAALNDKQIRDASRQGFVETIPDRTVCPERGYPILCSRGFGGRISPTVPLNYHVQSTAMWCTMKAMIRCHARLKEWQAKGFDGFMPLQVHDEIVFDFPAGRVLTGSPGPEHQNLWRIRQLQKLMEQSGEDIGVPTPVSIEHHAENWSEGTVV